MRHHHARRLRWSGPAGVVAVVALVAGFCPSARADDATAASSAAVALSERRAAEAFAAYTKNNYAAAVALYLDAYDAAPSGSILYNIARIYDMKLADRRLALNFYQRYIADPGAQADLIEVANQRLRELHDAELMAAKRPASRTVAVDATNQPINSPPSGARDGSRGRSAGWSTWRWIGATAGAVGVVGLGVGGGFGLAAMSQAHTANSLCAGNACTSQRGVDAAHSARTDATLSTIGFAAGGALLVAGAAVLFLDRDSPREQASPAGVQVRASATASAASLQLQGSW